MDCVPDCGSAVADATGFGSARISLAVYGKFFQYRFRSGREARFSFSRAVWRAGRLLRFRSRKTRVVAPALAAAYGLLAAAFCVYVGFATINYIK
jgi:hypothetical protein